LFNLICSVVIAVIRAGELLFFLNFYALCVELKKIKSTKVVMARGPILHQHRGNSYGSIDSLKPLKNSRYPLKKNMSHALTLPIHHQVASPKWKETRAPVITVRPGAAATRGLPGIDYRLS